MRLTASLRTRLVVIVLLGTVLPLGLVALWQVREVQRFGDRLLRERLEESLQQVIADMGARWAAQRAAALTLGEYVVGRPATVSANDARPEGRAYVPPAETEGRAYVRQKETEGRAYVPVNADTSLAAAYAQVRRTANRVTLREDGESARILLEPPDDVAERGQSGAMVDASVEIFSRHPGRRLGVVELQIPVSSLVPVSAGEVAGIGAVLAVIDRNGRALTPLPFEAPVGRDEFMWAGERWLVARISTHEPPLDFLATAPVAPFAVPFERAARRGVAVLALVLVVALVTTVAWTRRTLGSLRDLAGAATDIAQGNYARTVTAGGADEVGQLARAFNTMTASLQQSLDELSEKRSLAAIGEFAASLAHEVRNPLTSIRLDLQRLEEKVSGNTKLAEPVARALRSVVRLDAVVGGALKVARTSQLQIDRVDAGALLVTALGALEPECRARQIASRLDGTDTEHAVDGDSSALYQMFLNLLLNAVQATPAGGEVTVTVSGSDDWIEIAIADAGPGIGDEERQRVFEPFYTTKAEGGGLGLTVARRIVEAHHGTLILESELGHGTTVRVELPRSGRNVRVASA